MSTPLPQQRARQSLEAAQRASRKPALWLRFILPPAAEQKPEPPKRCASCGAPVPILPAEGEGLPCGH